MGRFGFDTILHYSKKLIFIEAIKGVAARRETNSGGQMGFSGGFFLLRLYKISGKKKLPLRVMESAAEGHFFF